MAIEFSFTLVYRLVELVSISLEFRLHSVLENCHVNCSLKMCMLASLVIIAIASYLKPLPTDVTRPFCRYIMALVFGYVFVLTADVASRFLGGGIAAIAVSSFCFSDPSNKKVGKKKKYHAQYFTEGKFNLHSNLSVNISNRR